MLPITQVRSKGEMGVSLAEEMLDMIEAIQAGGFSSSSEAFGH